MLGIKQIDRIPNSTIRDKTKVDDILKVMTSTKWKWAGHVARMNDNRWRELAEGYFQQWRDTAYVQGTRYKTTYTFRFQIGTILEKKCHSDVFLLKIY